MRKIVVALAVVLASVLSWLAAPAAEKQGKPSAARGREALFHRSLNPPLWPRRAYDNVWKQWGLKAKPADYHRAVVERYGLAAAPAEKTGLPLGLNEADGLFGKGIVNNCLMCHVGTVAGQTYVGLGNAGLDLQSLFEELTTAAGNRDFLSFPLSYVRGTVDVITPVAFLMQFRDADLNVRSPVKLDLPRDVCSRPPAWWLIKKKKTRDWTGIVAAGSTRVDLVNLMSPLNSGDYVRGHQPTFADIHEFLLTIPAPAYPFAVDKSLAARGQPIFRQHCARCHGTYGPRPTYPNRIVPLKTIGTDPVLALSVTKRNEEHITRSWLTKEIGPDGKPYAFTFHHGYQAPPLDGVWATAPYFHNGSVPTLYHVLNSKARPRLWTRSYRTGKEDYDPVQVGWKITVPDRAPDPKLPAFERRKVYDAGRRGQDNAGHTFGDKLTEEERMAVIEFLKTL